MSKSVLIKSVHVVCTILCTLRPIVRRVCTCVNDVPNKFTLCTPCTLCTLFVFSVYTCYEHTVHTVHTTSTLCTRYR